MGRGPGVPGVFFLFCFLFCRAPCPRTEGAPLR
jgi:hypothetical protein